MRSPTRAVPPQIGNFAAAQLSKTSSPVRKALEIHEPSIFIGRFIRLPPSFFFEDVKLTFDPCIPRWTPFGDQFFRFTFPWNGFSYLRCFNPSIGLDLLILNGLPIQIIFAGYSDCCLFNKPLPAATQDKIRRVFSEHTRTAVAFCRNFLSTAIIPKELRLSRLIDSFYPLGNSGGTRATRWIRRRWRYVS